MLCETIFVYMQLLHYVLLWTESDFGQGKILFVFQPF